MRIVIQRVTSASVSSEGTQTGAIENGFVALVGAADGDTMDDVAYCAKKTANLRVFEDEQGKMNLTLNDVRGAVLAVSQFTLMGDTRHGNRPSFINAARPETAKPLFDAYCAELRRLGLRVETGVFQTHMVVSLDNDGPVTILIDSAKQF